MILGAFQSQTGGGGEEKNPCPWWDSKRGPQPVASHSTGGETQASFMLVSCYVNRSLYVRQGIWKVDGIGCQIQESW